MGLSNIRPNNPIIYVQVLIIEVNTVPGMTPSTVLIHQVMTSSLIWMMQRSSNELDFEMSKLLLEAWYADINLEYSDYVHKILVLLYLEQVSSLLTNRKNRLYAKRIYLISCILLLRHWQSNLPCTLIGSSVRCLIWHRRDLCKLLVSCKNISVVSFNAFCLGFIISILYKWKEKPFTFQ